MDLDNLKFGLDTFGDTQNDDSGAPISAAATIRNVAAAEIGAPEIGRAHV